MPKERAISKKKSGGGGFVRLKIVVKMLQRSLIPGRMMSTAACGGEAAVADDVKEGHFAVMAVEDDELKRLVLPLSLLAHPSFLRLLEQAAEEYGFDRDGALTVPCRPSELEGLLAAAERGSAAAGWGCYEIKSC